MEINFPFCNVSRQFTWINILFQEKESCQFDKRTTFAEQRFASLEILRSYTMKLLTAQHFLLSKSLDSYCRKSFVHIICLMIQIKNAAI